MRIRCRVVHVPVPPSRIVVLSKVHLISVFSVGVESYQVVFFLKCQLPLNLSASQQTFRPVLPPNFHLVHRGPQLLSSISDTGILKAEFWIPTILPPFTNSAFPLAGAENHSGLHGTTHGMSLSNSMFRHPLVICQYPAARPVDRFDHRPPSCSSIHPCYFGHGISRHW